MIADEARVRRRLARVSRVVVKIGSSSLAHDETVFSALAEDLAEARARPGKPARRMVLVSSGAIALGMARLGMARRPRAMPALQAAAAAGQGELVQRWAEALGRRGLATAQVLLTHADLADRTRANNARAALTRLLEFGVIPVVNENDAVATDEIRFGDNDALAATVTPLVDGELLVLLTDVAGLLDDGGERLPFALDVEAVERYVRTERSAVGSGGMASKLRAARRATRAGASACIASAREPGVVTRLLAGESVGTLFAPTTKRLSGRKHWIGYTLRPAGSVVVDEGAARAVVEEGRSLLAVGALGIRGRFEAGALVSIETTDRREFARGLSQLSSEEATRVAGHRGDGASPVLVHRDDLVTFGP